MVQNKCKPFESLNWPRVAGPANRKGVSGYWREKKKRHKTRYTNCVKHESGISIKNAYRGIKELVKWRLVTREVPTAEI